MDNINISDAENEYRLHLRREELSNPEKFAAATKALGVHAQKGFEDVGRGALLVIDNGQGGGHVYVPTEMVDWQFGSDVSDLCRHYNTEEEWILVGITNGRLFPIVMPL